MQKKKVLMISKKRISQTNESTMMHKKDICIVTHQDNNLGFGQAGVEQLRDCQDSSSDLLCCVLIIVGSDPQHDHLGRETHNFLL